MRTLTKVAIPLLLALASTAHAQTADEHASRATRFYNLQDWPNALKEYREAYAADPKPETLWSIAQVQRLSGDCRGAIFTYKAYMRGASSGGANAAQDLITKCEATIAAQERAAERATETTTASPQTPHEITATPTTPTTPPPPVTPQKPEKPAPPGPWILDPLGDVLGVVGLGGLVTGGVFLVLGNVGMGQTSQAATYQTYDHNVDVARTQQQVGVAVAIGGAVFAGLAVWRFAVVAGRNKKEAAVSLTPMVGGGYASYSMRF